MGLETLNKKIVQIYNVLAEGKRNTCDKKPIVKALENTPGVDKNLSRSGLTFTFEGITFKINTGKNKVLNIGGHNPTLKKLAKAVLAAREKAIEAAEGNQTYVKETDITFE